MKKYFIWHLSFTNITINSFYVTHACCCWCWCHFLQSFQIKALPVHPKSQRENTFIHPESPRIPSAHSITEEEWIYSLRCMAGHYMTNSWKWTHTAVNKSIYTITPAQIKHTGSEQTLKCTLICRESLKVRVTIIKSDCTDITKAELHINESFFHL